MALKTLGTDPSEAEVAVSPGHTYLIEVAEHGNDALVELLDSKNQLIVRADHPERRTGTRRAIVTAPSSGGISVRVSGTEHPQVHGTATVRAFDLAALQSRPDCAAILRALAEADTAYAAGQEISHGRATAGSGSARDAYQRAADGYTSAERSLAEAGDQRLRGETQLALAGVAYFDLQQWASAADWARAAAETLASNDPYRRARADALRAAAWIEMGRSASSDRASAQTPSSADLLGRARAELRQLSRFHLQRGELYDAGLQFTNISLTYLYESRFPECVTASARSSHLFGSIHEIPREAQAWQNRALCLWGLGRLPEALSWFERARKDTDPQSYPANYLTVVNNTALADYVLGHFDDSLRLFDGALAFAMKVQARRFEAQSLYGIGVDYYALGDISRAREFLEQSLAIRTVALDKRGRMATLRALATANAEQGNLDEALAFDREALGLAVGVSSVGRIRIQLAVHTAAAGHGGEALAQLDDVLATDKGAEPIIHAEAVLQRALLLRAAGRPKEAVADLMVARTRLRQLGDVSEEFAAELELARTLRLLGLPHAALATVERALSLADAVRTQTANPELRAQLQTPLRSAYDLKIELLRARYELASSNALSAQASSLAATAFLTADASRARTLADVAAQEYSPAVRHTLAAEFRHRDELYAELSGRRFALEQRLDRFGSNDGTSRHLMADIAELERRVDTINTFIAASTRREGRPALNSSASGKLPDVPARTALVSYWLGAESAYAWVVLPRGIHWIRLGSPQAVTDAATAFYHSLARLIDVPIERRLQTARAMHELILKPLDSWLAGVRQWVVVPDGALDYVPFAALRPSPEQTDSFVVMQHDIALTPAAWMLDTRGEWVPPPHRRALLLVADPVYEADDPRLRARAKIAGSSQASARIATEPGRALARLPYTATEAADIAAEFPAAEVDQLIGVDATRDRLLALDWSRYRFIHIATHGLVDAQVPQLSALVLDTYDAAGNSIDGAVRVADLSLQTLTADVATFSACDTALGREVPSEGLVGISSTVLARGARAVVASLWPVSDEIGARLMTDFYRHLLHDSMSAPAALGAAMRSVVLRDESADPALWAAFQVSVMALGPGLPSRSAEPVNSSTITRP